jgi:hypothetical protein
MRDLERRPSPVGHRSGSQRRRSPRRSGGCHRTPAGRSAGWCRRPRRGPGRKLRRTTPPTHKAGIARFLFTQLNQLAEDKRFELLRVSPTRFPILLLAVRHRSGPYVTRYDGTERTFPAAAERPRMRRKLRRTGRCSDPPSRPPSRRRWTVSGTSAWRPPAP